jgi:hypothetical protein
MILQPQLEIKLAFYICDENSTGCAGGAARGRAPHMDVLEYWNPNIDWSKFDQGSITDDIWKHFKELVQLCHAFRHWEEATTDIRLSPPRQWEWPPESARQFKKRQDQWKAEVRRREGHMNRAGFLADQQIAEMSYLVSKDDEGTSAWKMYFALRVAVAEAPHLRCKAAAFEGFNANGELDGEVAEIALRWLIQGGYGPT